MCFICFTSHLRKTDLTVWFTGGHQFLVGAITDLSAVFQHQDMIRVADRACPLGNNDGSCFTEIFGQSLAKPCVGLIIQRA